MIAKRIARKAATSSAARLVRYMVAAKGDIAPETWARTADYILDTKEGTSQGEKVASYRVTNCGTDDPADATVAIQNTQTMNTRSKADKTYHLVFSFPPGEEPALEVLHAIEDELCTAIGYADHQRISAVHIDTDHLHVHVAINKVHPTGFQNVEPYFDKRRLMAECERLEIKYQLQRTNHGIGVNQHEKDHGKSGRIDLAPELRPGERDSRFRAHLRKSYHRALAERPEAQTLNGLRNLSGSRMDDLTQRTTVLLSGHARSGMEQSGEKPADGLRRAHDGAGTDAGGSGRVIGNAAASIEAQAGIETLASYVASELGAAMREAGDWQAVHAALAEHGLEIKPRGAGLVIGDSGLPLWVRASQCGRDFAMKSMTARLGPYEAPDGQGRRPQDAKRRYEPRPIQRSPASAALFAQYQRERQIAIQARKAGFERIKSESAAYREQLRNWTAQQRLLLKASARGPMRRVVTATIRTQADQARQKNQQQAQQQREQLYQQTTMPSWADWLVLQANGGNAQALAVLRSRESWKAKVRGDLLTAKDADRARDILLKSLKPTTRKDGSVAYSTADGGVVIDRKTHVQAKDSTAGAALVALSLAADRFTGQALVVEGADQFRQDVARLAGMHRLDVVFSDPVMEQARARASAEREATQQPKHTKPQAPKGPEKGRSGPSKVITNWIETRNEAHAKISSVDYHRLWTASDSGKAEYQGRRKMPDGSEVLLLARKGEMLVMPAGPRTVAKASKWAIGRTVTLDTRGRFMNTSRAIER